MPIRLTAATDTSDNTTDPGTTDPGTTDPGTTDPGSDSGSGLGIIEIDASDGSEQLSQFLDILENPCNYKGKVVYLTAIGPTERPDPFLWADKFYFNEGCEWHESPFAFKMVE